MSKLTLYSAEGKSLGEISASDEVFGKKMNEAIVHSALVWFLASRRRGTQSTLTKAEVRGGGRKPWRQKGTGRARVGSIRSPLWRGGGVIFGPKPRSYNYNLPKKIRNLALRVALSEKAKSGKLKVIEELKLPEMKTKKAAKVLKGLGISGKILIILEEQNKIFQKASRNLKEVLPIFISDFNIFNLLNAEWVVMERKVVLRLKERLL